MPSKAPLLRSVSARRFDVVEEEIDEEAVEDLEEKLVGKVNYISLISYALVNAAVSIPCLFGYASIIFNAPIFRPHMSNLTKLVIFSSAVHQTVFSSISTLWFSVGQVQDAGLIFLSRMAGEIAHEAKSKEEAMSTVIVLLGLATCSLGLVVFLVGRFRLAKWVYYIPSPVVAGYLAFIGFFCFAAGLGLACDRDVSTYKDFGEFFEEATPHEWVLVAPAVIAGLTLSFVAGRRNAPWYALPCTIAAIPLGFYVALPLTGSNLNEARSSGWVNPVDDKDSEPFYHIFSSLQLGLVNWSIVPRLIPTWASMCFVVNFASALDIVALEMDSTTHEAPLDLNKELSTVGVSNMVSGLLFGFTGSYIFSVTLFTKKTKLNTRAVGAMLAALEFLLFVAPISLLSYVPKFFFAATLIFIANDLTVEWLFESYFKMSLREYAIVLLTFFSIALSENNLVFGIGLGCAASYFGDFLIQQRGEKVEKAKTVDREVFELDDYLFGTNLETILGKVRALLVPRKELVSEKVEKAALIPQEGEAAALILDFSKVREMDSEQAARGLSRIRKLAKKHRAVVIFSGMKEDIKDRLKANAAITAEVIEVCNVDAAKRVAKEKKALRAVLALSRMRVMAKNNSKKAARVIEESTM